MEAFQINPCRTTIWCMRRLTSPIIRCRKGNRSGMANRILKAAQVSSIETLLMVQLHARCHLVRRVTAQPWLEISRWTWDFKKCLKSTGYLRDNSCTHQHKQLHELSLLHSCHWCRTSSILGRRQRTLTLDPVYHSSTVQSLSQELIQTQLKMASMNRRLVSTQWTSTFKLISLPQWKLSSDWHNS